MALAVPVAAGLGYAAATGAFAGFGAYFGFRAVPQEQRRAIGNRVAGLVRPIMNLFNAGRQRNAQNPRQINLIAGTAEQCKELESICVQSCMGGPNFQVAACLAGCKLAYLVCRARG